jgi:DNA polymerase IV
LFLSLDELLDYDDWMMGSSGDELADKAAAFRQLEQGGGASDDEFDAAELAMRRSSRAFFLQDEGRRRRQRRNRIATLGQEVSSPRRRDEEERQRVQQQQSAPKRVFSAPTPAAASHTVIKGTPTSVAARRLRGLLRGEEEVSPGVGEETRIPESARPAVRALRRSEATPVAGAAAKRLLHPEEGTPSRGAAVAKKRKTTGKEAKNAGSAKGAGEQIFKDLSFHYIPDNDIAPARRIRITKAKENGASWTRFAKFATHIIVDKNIRYDEIRHLVVDAAAGEGAGEGPVVVNEDYPIDCVQFRAVLDPFQRKYQLVGQPDGKEERAVRWQRIVSSSEGVPSSLPLKAPQRDPRKWDYVPPVGTPERSDESSSQASRIQSSSVVGSSQPIVVDVERITESPAQSQTEASKGNAETAASQESQDDSIPQPVTRIDELSDYISLMQEYKDVPLDDDEDDMKSVSAVDHHSESDEASSDKDRLRKKRHRTANRHNEQSSSNNKSSYTEQFACNRAGPQNASSDNPNARTIEVLQKMASYYDQTNDHWRTTAYRKAITTLRRQEAKITTEDEAFRLPSVGRRLAQKIEEIVTTDRLQRLEYAQMDPRNGVLQLFLGVYGVGTAQAQQWVAQGLRTLEDVRREARLTPNQLVGVEHYDDLNTKIPRREVEALGAVVKEAAAEIDPKVELIIGGSYRRGAERSSDIDFIVTERDTKSALDLRPFLDKLVHRLTEDGFLVARLASGKPGSTDGGSKWHGCCVLPKARAMALSSEGNEESSDRPVWRRIDFLVVPDTEIGAALIYFTGNDIFNRSMRLLASRKGMRLNQRGLYKDVMRGPGRIKVTEGELLEGRDERRIFEILGLQWREPHERWC